MSLKEFLIKYSGTGLKRLTIFFVILFLLLWYAKSNGFN